VRNLVLRLDLPSDSTRFLVAMKMAPLLRRRRGRGGGPEINHPWPLLIEEGNHAAIFMHGAESKLMGLRSE
jgi:hypothetical protein